ncbi:hypothetical protein NKG94_46820 [Micromonospora sp. M12]
MSIVLLLAAALIPPQITDPDRAALVRDGLWIAVVLVQYATGFIVGTWGWGDQRRALDGALRPHSDHRAGRVDHLHGVGGNLLGKPVTWPAVRRRARHRDHRRPLVGALRLHRAGRPDRPARRGGRPRWPWPATRTPTSTCR